MKSVALIFAIVLLFSISVSADYTDQMVIVPAGTFIMGDGGPICEYTHEVTLTRGFYLGQHEVTNQEYLEALQWAYDHGHATADTTLVRDNLDGSTEVLLDLWKDHSEIQFDGAGDFYLRESPHLYAQNAYPDGYDPSNHPVQGVRWYGAVRYCDWLSLQAGLPRAYEQEWDPGPYEWVCNGGDPYGAEGYRLPTDAEWEYAARYNDGRPYPWGDDAPDCSRVNFYEYCGSGEYCYCVGWTSPVGSYPDAPQALGLSDMAGNLWEWCNDWWVCNLGTSPVTDPTGPSSGGDWVMRGGSFGITAYWLLCAHRYNRVMPFIRVDIIGFRVARTVPTGSNIETESPRSRSQLHLDINQPNPFAGVTRIGYSAPTGSAISLVIYDPAGRVVRRMMSNGQATGSLTWDATDALGQRVAAGAYFMTLRNGDEDVTKRFVVIR
ncbi:MAG: SUMF1/EgtB/PvdO family nonheme iron enzyme [Candidatus Eisenbacteria sp.]|nr:SUMF1/EgtB/PvdO family nonheme iron enzyme [Candidatus Eisenbacteria bacterium]